MVPAGSLAIVVDVTVDVAGGAAMEAVVEPVEIGGMIDVDVAPSSVVPAGWSPSLFDDVGGVVVAATVGAVELSGSSPRGSTQSPRPPACPSRTRTAAPIRS